MTQQQEQVTEQNAAWFAETFGRIVSNVGRELLGKDDVIRLALTAMFAGGQPCKARIRASSSPRTFFRPTSRA